MIDFIKNNIFIVIIFLVTLSLGFLTFLTFIDKSFINLNDYNLTSFLFFLIDNTYYKKNKFIKDLTISYIELYFLKIYILSNAKKSILDKYFKFI